MIRRLKKFLRGMQSKLIEIKLAKEPLITINKSAKVFFPGILYREDCTLDIGDKSVVHANLVFERPSATIRIGSNTFIGSETSIICSEDIRIGNDVLISWRCSLIDHDAHSVLWDHRKDDLAEWMHGRKDWTHVVRKPIVIGNKAWIGFNSVILKGVTIGEGAVVGAGSVVTKDVAPYTVVAGNPAQFVKEIKSE